MLEQALLTGKNEYNCSIEQEEICRYFNIRGYPTFYYLTADKKAVAYNGPRTIDGLTSFVNAHNPDNGDPHCAWGDVNFGFLDLFKEAFQEYWQYILGFGVVLPMIVGYFLAECLNRRDAKKLQALRQQKQKQAQARPAQESPS